MHIESRPSVTAITNRKKFAESPVWNALMPNRYIDQYGTRQTIGEFLRAGWSIVALPSHPTIEDVPRLARLFSSIPEVAERHVLVPVAIHQMGLVDKVGVPLLGFEAAPIVTQHSLDRQKYERREIVGHFSHYVNRMVDVLKKNGVVVAAFQADQAPKLEAPATNMLDLIMKRTDDAKVDTIGFVFVGIDVPGRDITKARSVTLARHVYEFTLGRLFTKSEVIQEAMRAHLSVDRWGYQELTKLVPPAYRIG